jgi:hypothetical protein
MAVHDVEMDVVGTGIGYGADFVAEGGEIGGEYGRRYLDRSDHRTFVAAG